MAEDSFITRRQTFPQQAAFILLQYFKTIQIDALSTVDKSVSCSIPRLILVGYKRTGCRKHGLYIMCTLQHHIRLHHAMQRISFIWAEKHTHTLFFVPTFLPCTWSSSTKKVSNFTKHDFFFFKPGWRATIPPWLQTQAGWNRPQPLSSSLSQVNAFRGKIKSRRADASGSPNHTTAAWNSPNPDDE